MLTVLNADHPLPPGRRGWGDKNNGGVVVGGGWWGVGVGIGGGWLGLADIYESTGEVAGRAQTMQLLGPQDHPTS